MVPFRVLQQLLLSKGRGADSVCLQGSSAVVVGTGCSLAEEVLNSGPVHARETSEGLCYLKAVDIFSGKGSGYLTKAGP